MQLNILVTGGLYSTQCAYSAWQFCQSAVQGGHRIAQIFFYQDGVSQANALSQPLDDEFEPVSRWTEFANTHGAELVLCISSAERRGVVNTEQARELGLPASNVASAFTVAGLGQLHQACFDCDRTVTFK